MFELGSDFHPGADWEENAILGGIIAGLTRRETRPHGRHHLLRRAEPVHRQSLSGCTASGC